VADALGSALSVGEGVRRTVRYGQQGEDGPETSEEDDGAEGEHYAYSNWVLRIPRILLLTADYRREYRYRMDSSPKRTVQVNVKMSPRDYDTLKKAANAIWPDAELTNSGIVLGLAKLGAREILKKKGKKG
jgi:hypothetical protein